MNVLPFTFPSTVEQRAGNIPLADCINDTTTPTPSGDGCWRYLFFDEPAHDEVESRLDPGFDGLHVYLADGKLWTAQVTAVNFGADDKAGVAWYVISPNFEDGRLRASIENEGQFGIPRNNAIFPTAAVTSSGKGVLSFTLVGQDHYPSAAYAPFDAAGVGNVRVAAPGIGPVDGYTGYKPFGAFQRFGDYGAAFVEGGKIWAASEYIGQTCTLEQYMIDTADSPFGTCGGTRRGFANWYTRVSLIDPSKF